MSSWVAESVGKISADYQRSADTHLIKLEGLNIEGIDIYLKDESTHPTGSLKHRLARSLFLYALCNGKITEDSTVVEASSGSSAVSEAYFARMIGRRDAPQHRTKQNQTDRALWRALPFCGVGHANA